MEPVISHEEGAPPCRVKECPALAKKSSIYGYCPIHHLVATDPDMYAQALKGKISAGLREFAENCERYVYPKKTW